MANDTEIAFRDSAGSSNQIVGVNNPLPVYISGPGQADGSALAAVRGRSRGMVGNAQGLTRPSDTSAYAAKDVISNSTAQGLAAMWRFPNMARVNGGGGRVVKALLFTSQTANVEAFRLHLFSAPQTPIADNAQCTAPLYAGADDYIGRIDFPAARTEGTGATAAYAENSYDVLEFGTGAATKDLYGILETPNGFTPASAQTFDIQLVVSRD